MSDRSHGRVGVAEGVVLCSAFLLFSLELAVAKALLPRFGGSPMVWTTSMLAYQILLLGGYAYAHGLARRFSPRRQALVHGTVLLIAVGVAASRLRSSSFVSNDPAATSVAPIAGLLLTLLGTLAIPFLALAATSPLVQHWRQRVAPEVPVYRLYAVSNVGSFGALLAYPFLIEPRLGLPLQFGLWSALFGAMSMAMGFLGWRSRGAAVALRAVDGKQESGGKEPLSWGRVTMWVVLAGGTSALLLSATNELCQDLAVFPFLWVLPLSLYLLSFSLTFRTRPLGDLMPWAALVTLIAMATTSMSMLIPAPVHVVSISGLVFVLSLAAHRELYRLRPAAAALTSYYLWIAAGSGLGAVGVALVAPVAFFGYWEFQLSIVAVWIALVMASLKDRQGALHAGSRRHTAMLLWVAGVMLINRVPERWLRAGVSGWSTNWTVPVRLALAGLLAAALWYGWIGRRRWAGARVWSRILAGLVLFVVECSLVQRYRDDRRASGMVARNFFGVVRVRETMHHDTGVALRQLTHGRINHGWQYLNPGLLREPTAYHSRSTGVGGCIAALQEKRDAISIGVTGLGVGALAAYPRESDTIVFYEIDPQVADLAWGSEAVFSFLNDCPGRVEVVMGDARQSMQQERLQGRGRAFDVLALDAFSSDAIPMHLLTREAIGLYLDQLAPHGVLAVNISNRFLNIEPVLRDAAEAYGLHAVMVDSKGDAPVRARSLWILMARTAAALQIGGIDATARPLRAERVTWTDAYGSPFSLIKWWSPDALRYRLLPPPRRPSDATVPSLAPVQTPAAPEA